MDSSTGVINVSQSETGLHYNIGFVKSGTNDTCISQLILGSDGSKMAKQKQGLGIKSDKLLLYDNINKYM